jgi:hypothetical protein
VSGVADERQAAIREALEENCGCDDFGNESKCIYAAEAAALAALVGERDALLAALERIAEQQPKTLGSFRKHGIVFDGPLGNDPKNWQHVAFSIYTDLCEVDHWARSALDASSAVREPGGQA